MIFHSLDFVVFFLVTVTVYWRLPHRAQNVLLVVASYFFYGYVHPWFLLLVFATTVLDYFAGRGMAARADQKRLFLGLSLAGNLGMLGFFKYFNFFADNVHAVLLPLGLDIPQFPHQPVGRSGRRCLAEGRIVVDQLLNLLLEFCVLELNRHLGWPRPRHRLHGNFLFDQ